MKLRFSIRDLLWLVLVVALAVGWWLVPRQSYEKRHYWQIEQINGTTVITNLSNHRREVVLHDGQMTSCDVPLEIELAARLAH